MIRATISIVWALLLVLSINHDLRAQDSNQAPATGLSQPASNSTRAGPSVVTVTPPAPERGTQILQWDYPRDMLYSNSDPATKVAYAETIYHFSPAAGVTQPPTPDQVTAYFNDRRQAFLNTPKEDRWKAASMALVGIATLSSGVGALYGAEAITVSTVVQASPALVGGSSSTIGSLNDLFKMSDADLNKFLSDKVNENLPNIMAAGMMNPQVQKPLAAYLLTGNTNPNAAQVIAAYGTLPATKKDIEEALTTSRYPVPVLLEAYRRIIRDEIQKGIPLSDSDKQIMGKLLTALQKADNAQELLTPKSEGLDSQTRAAILQDVRYVTSAFHDLGTIVKLSPAEQAQLDKALTLADRSASLGVELAATSVNPLAVAASGLNIVALLFGPETSGPNPFQLIMDQIIALQREVNQLAVQVQQLRIDIDDQFVALHSAIYQLNRQVQISREIMLSHFDTILAEVRGISENKNLDDWAAFHTSVTVLRTDYERQSSTETGVILNEIREDRIRENFARLLDHLSAGKGGAGAQAVSGPENCFEQLIATILKGGKQTFLAEAKSLAASMDKPDYDQRAYCVAGVAKEMLDGFPRETSAWLTPDYSMMLPADLESEGRVKAWKKERFVVSSPLDVATFLFRIEPELASLPDSRLRAELATKLLDATAPLIRSYGVTNGLGSANLISAGYQGMSVNLATNLKLLFMNSYQRALLPLVEWLKTTEALYSGVDKFNDAFYPVVSWKYDLYQNVYDRQDQNMTDQRNALAARASAVDSVAETILGGLVSARNASLQKLGLKLEDRMKWTGIKVSVLETDSYFKRHIPTATFPSAFTEEKQEYDSKLKTLPANVVAAKALDAVYQHLFDALELNIKCTWYAHPNTAEPTTPGVGNGGHKGAISPDPRDTEVPPDCKSLLTSRKWEELTGNYSRLLTHANMVFNGVLPDATNGLSSYLSALRDPTSTDLLEQKIVATAFAMKVVEILYQNRTRASSLTKTSSSGHLPRAPSLTRLQAYSSFLDAILKHTSTAANEHQADKYYFEELMIPRPTIQGSSNPITLSVFQRYDYQKASMFFKTTVQMDPLRASSPEVKDIASKVSFPSRRNSKQAEQVFSYLSRPQLATVSANQAVIATVQQYETVRGILSFANLQLVREGLTRQARATQMNAPAPSTRAADSK